MIKATIRKGVLEDILESENGSLAIEFEGNILEINPKHFQKVFHYMALETEVELEIDMEQSKLLSIEAKDPTIRLNRLQEYLFLSALDNETPTYEVLMYYFNNVEHIYSNFLKGKTFKIKEDKIAA